MITFWLMLGWRNFWLQPVGRMVLNKNVDNFFAENEQLAFCPGVIVPGIYYSDDKMFQTRIFSYSDTQRYRLGANYLMLPVNAPKCAHHNNHHDGVMNFMHRDEEVNWQFRLQSFQIDDFLKIFSSVSWGQVLFLNKLTVLHCGGTQ